MKRSVKEIVKERAKFCCEYCLAQFKYTGENFSIEHILPKAKGGTDELDNLALSCQSCNNSKFIAIEAIDHETGQAALLFHPRNDNWADHFVWSDNFTKIIGISPTGRATVNRLKINRQGLINNRTVLVMADLHPPF